MKTTQALTQLLALATAATATQYGHAVRRGLSDAMQARRISGRSGSGPAAVLTVDDTDEYNKSPAGVQLASVAGANEVMASEQVEGAYTTCIPVFTGATVSDCEAVLGDIRANNGTLSVAGGLCLNWWEGTCLARVCAREQGTTYTADAQWVADAIEESALDVCVAKGDSGVVADCEDNADPCGTYRFWLQAQP